MIRAYLFSFFLLSALISFPASVFGDDWPSEDRKYEYPLVEIFGGYSMFNMSGAFSENYKEWNKEILLLPNDRKMEVFKWFRNGGNASVAFNFADEFGIVVDARYHSGNMLEYEGPYSGLSFYADNLKYVNEFTSLAVMAGPRFTYRKSKRITPFGHFLVGANRFELTQKPLKCTLLGGGTDCLPIKQEWALDDDVFDHTLRTGISIAGGGGLDLNVNKTFSIRLIQADYVASRFKKDIIEYYEDSDVATSFSYWVTNHNKFTVSSGVVIRLGWK